MKTFVENYLDEHQDDEYCLYCGHDRGYKAQCCGEVHFIKLKDMDMAERLAIIEAEYQQAFGDSNGSR